MMLLLVLVATALVPMLVQLRPYIVMSIKGFHRCIVSFLSFIADTIQSSRKFIFKLERAQANGCSGMNEIEISLLLAWHLCLVGSRAYVTPLYHQAPKECPTIPICADFGG